MKICAYVFDKYAKQTYAEESHDVRAWPGFEMALHSIRMAGYTPIYAGRATAHEYNIVLVSITSDCDWWPFLAERATWKPGKYIVVVGGAGVLNVRPFLNYVDVFVLGRAETILPEIVSHHVRSERYICESVIWSDSFDVNNKYKIAQTDKPYPYSFSLTNGKPYKESSIGCPNKCLFCGYTWQRKYFGDGTFSAGAESMNTGNRERTIKDLMKLTPDKWQDAGPLRIVGLDGMSERLRFMVNKRISRAMLRRFFGGLSEIRPPHQVKIYCIVGYPGEKEADWFEFVEDLKHVDDCLKKDKQWSLLVHFTPFRAMPATPCATWEMSMRNYRGIISKTLKTHKMKGNIFFQGNRFWAVEGMGTDSLPTVIQSAICLRGTEQDSANMMLLARAKKYWGANTKDKQATLDSLFDTEKLMASYNWDNLPTKYLSGYVKQESIFRLSLRGQKRKDN